MASASAGFARILYQAFDGGCEVSVDELMQGLAFESEDYLDKLAELDGFLIASRLELRPHISQGDIEDARVLVYADRAKGFEAQLTESLAQGELSRVEYKSTLFVSVRRIREQGHDPAECWDEGVIHSSLKTICGYLNKDGGEIYVGVEPNKNICGISWDYEILTQRSRDFDGWVNRLVELIKTRFHESGQVLTYLDFDFEMIAGVPVSRILVRPRRKISFVGDKDGYFHCYVRSGPRVEEIPIQEIPEFVETRRLEALSVSDR